MRRPPEPRRSRRAFSLLEVLVALCILALAVVVLGAAYLNVLISYDVAARGMTAQEDVAFARSLVLTEPDREKLEKGGEFESAGGRRVKWSVELQSSTVADVFQVNFACELTDPNRTEVDRVTESFMLLRPTWSTDAAERDKLREEAKTRIAEIQGKQKR